MTEAEKLHPSWKSPEDDEWAKKIDINFVPVAKRHGRLMFQLVMAAGTTGYALGQIGRFTQGNRNILQAIQSALGNLNFLCETAVKASGFTLEQFAQCKRDVEMLGVLMSATRPRGSSGLILPS